MTKTNPIVFAISVLTINRRETLVELLDELAKIQRQDVEIVIVDNGSHDGTASFVSERFPTL